MPVPAGTPKLIPPGGSLPPFPPYTKVKPRAPETPSSAVPSGAAQTTPAAAPLTTPGASSSSTAAPAGSGTGPSYGMSEKQKEASEKEKKDVNKAFNSPIPSVPMRQGPLLSAQSHTLPQHHHHHHHHHTHTHVRNPTVIPSPSEVGGNNPLYRSVPGRHVIDVARGYPPQRRQAETEGMSLSDKTHGPRPMMSMSVYAQERERIAREREKAEEGVEKQRAIKAGLPGIGSAPSTAATSNPYPRPSIPTSPTVSRSLPAPGPATSTHQTTASPQLPASTVSSSSASRPNLPQPDFANLGARSLPSPFERDGRERSTGTAQRPASTSQDVGGSQPAHHRSLSGSSNRIETLPSLGGVGQTNSSKSKAQNPMSTAPPPPGQSARDNSVQPSPSGRVPGAPQPRDQMRDLVPSRAPKSPSKPSQPPVTAQSRYAYPSSYATSYAAQSHEPFAGFSIGGYSGFSTWAERDRARQQEQERIKVEQHDREERVRREKEEKERRERMWQPNVGQPEIKTVQHPRQTATPSLTDPYRQRQSHEKAAPGSLPKIELLNQPVGEPYDATIPSVLQQIAPQREPRPYTYTAKVEPPAPREPPRQEKEYVYTPREKRPRMDAAVEDAHRRGSVGKPKRRREEDRQRSPAAQPREDLQQLTKAIKHWPEVTSSPVEVWLKTVSDLTRVVTRVQYDGSDWSVARCTGVKFGDEGGIVQVRINGPFLGDGWTLRGEPDWDQCTYVPNNEVELGRGGRNPKIWGTDVYTDDSDLGLVLIHAGWVKWRAEKQLPKAKGDLDSVMVTVRMVPRLVHYTATERNGVRSSNWGNGHDGLSIVVEGVERSKITFEDMNLKKNKKLRMAEMAAQRSVMLGRPTMGEERLTLRMTNEGPNLVFVPGKGGAFRYTPASLTGWLDETTPEEEHSLWTHDLELEGKSGNFICSIDRASGDGAIINIQESDPYTGRLRNGPALAARRQPFDLFWVDEGLIVRTGESSAKNGVFGLHAGKSDGFLCPAERFRWIKRKDGGFVDSDDEDTRESSRKRDEKIQVR